MHRHTSSFRISCVSFIGCLAVLFATSVSAKNGLSVVNQAVDVARKLVTSENQYDKILGAGILSDVGDPRALAILEEFAMSHDLVYQRSAIDTLIGVQHPSAIDLIYRLASTDTGFTQFLTQSLATNPRPDMGEFLVSLLQNSKPQIQQHAIQALVHLEESPEAVDIIRRVVKAESSLQTTRVYGYYYLAQRGLGGQFEQELLDIVATGDLSQREVAAVAFRYVESEKSRDALQKLQRSSDARVSLAAIASFAAQGDEASTKELVNIIARGKSLNAEVGASALRRLPPKLAHEVSLELFALNLRPDPGSRLLEAWRAIEWDATDIYEWGLNNTNIDVRMQALWLIGERQERHMLQRLGAFLNDENPRIRGMAAWAIVHIAPEDYIPGTKV